LNNNRFIPETTLKKCMRASTSFLKSIQQNNLFSEYIENMKNKKNHSKQSSRSRDKDKSEQVSTSRKDKPEFSANLKSKEKHEMIISNNFNSKFKSRDQKLNQSNVSNTKNLTKKPEKYICDN